MLIFDKNIKIKNYKKYRNYNENKQDNERIFDDFIIAKKAQVNRTKQLKLSITI